MADQSLIFDPVKVAPQTLQPQSLAPLPAVETKIPLGVSSENPLAGAGAVPAQMANPLSLVGSLAETQNKLNEAKLFRETFQARQRAGQIIAMSPDLASAVKNLQGDEQVGAFLPDLINTMTSSANTWQQYKGQVQTQTGEAFAKLGPILVGGAVNPGSIVPNLSAMLNNIPDEGIRRRVGDSAGRIVQSLTDNLPKEPDGSYGPAAQTEYAKRLMANGISTGSLDAINKLVAQPGTAIIGGATVPVTTGAGISSAFSTQAPGQVKLVPGSGGSGPTEGSGGGSTFKTADGTELKIGTSPSLITGLGGQKGLTPAQSAAATSRMTEWNGPELHAFQNSQLNEGFLNQMGADFDTMAKAGGMQVPGTAGQFRSSFAKAINTLYQGMGEKPPYDPLAAGAAENLIKNTRTMGITLLTTLLGNQREAAQTISGITQAVPSIDNSYLGGKILIDTLGAANQRNIDRRNFENVWQAKNQGNLQGADESFNEQAPMKDYVAKVLDKYGLSSDGFKDMGALDNAARLGYLTKPQYVAEAKKLHSKEAK